MDGGFIEWFDHHGGKGLGVERKTAFYIWESAQRVMGSARSGQLKQRFDRLDEALDGLSNHDRFGLLLGMVGMILRQYMREGM